MATEASKIETKLQQEEASTNSVFCQTETKSQHENHENVRSNLKVENPLFFQIKYKGKTSYLLGTIHCLPLSILPKPVQEIIRNVNTLLLEEPEPGFDDPITEEDLALEDVLLTLDEIDYFSALPEHMIRRLNTLLSVLLIEPPGNKIKINFLLDLMCCESIIVARNGMDNDLYELYKNKNTEILGLDDDKVRGDDIYDFAEYRELNPEDCYSALYHWHEQSGKAINEATERLMTNYCAGELNSLEKIWGTSAEMQTDETLERNLSWIPKIVEAHCNKTAACLFAFGAMHLFGVHGVLNLLQCHGFEIRRMSPQGDFIPYNSPLRKPELSVDQYVTEKQTYQLLRTQILEPSEPSISWMYAVKKAADEFSFLQWKKNYKHPYHENDGYGPGALVLYKGNK